MNKLVKQVGTVHEGHGIMRTFGVIETPCYPCTYYGGLYTTGRNGEPLNHSNWTCYFHRTIEEAERAAMRAMSGYQEAVAITQASIWKSSRRAARRD